MWQIHFFEKLACLAFVTNKDCHIKFVNGARVNGQVPKSGISSKYMCSLNNQNKILQSERNTFVSNYIFSVYNLCSVIHKMNGSVI